MLARAQWKDLHLLLHYWVINGGKTNVFWSSSRFGEWCFTQSGLAVSTFLLLDPFDCFPVFFWLPSGKGKYKPRKARAACKRFMYNNVRTWEDLLTFSPWLQCWVRGCHYLRPLEVWLVMSRARAWENDALEYYKANLWKPKLDDQFALLHSQTRGLVLRQRPLNEGEEISGLCGEVAKLFLHCHSKASCSQLLWLNSPQWYSTECYLSKALLKQVFRGT